jgi:hypothetical protein
MISEGLRQLVEELGPVEAGEAAPLFETPTGLFNDGIELLAPCRLDLLYALLGRRVYHVEVAVLGH